MGPGAAGKSTLAVQLGRLTGLEVVELDRLFWQPGLSPTSAEEWTALQEKLAASPGWIMDGDLGPYDVVRPRLRAADTVVVLDTPRWRCVWRAVRRPRERRDFWQWLWTWRRRYRPRLKDAIAADAPQAQVYVIRKKRDLGRFLDLSAGATPGQ